MDIKSHTKFRAHQVVNLFRSASPGIILLLLFCATGLISATFSKDPDEFRQDFDYQFTIKDLEGNRIPVESFKGKVIFLNMWATWCGPCRAEMPGIQALYDKIDKDKVAFIMLSIDPDDDLGKVKRYVTTKAFTFKAYLPSGYLTDQLDVPSIPTTFVISREGKVMKKEVGARQYDTPEFQKFLEKLSE